MTTLNNVVKRRKTSNYMQINNFPVQEDLGDLQAIGLLTYIMSLPEDWVLHKTQLQSVFTRRTVESAWKKLAAKKYAIGFSCFMEGGKGKQYFYNVSDLPFTQDDYDQFVNDVILAITADGRMISSIEPMVDSNLVIPTEIYNVQNVQYKTNSTKATNTKEIITKETQTNTHSLSIDNYQEPQKKDEDTSSRTAETKIDEKMLIETCNEFYSAFAIGRWDKKTWNKLVKSFVTETISANRHVTIPMHKLKGYVFKSIENMAQHHDYKHSEEYKAYKETVSELNQIPIEMDSPTNHFYNWLEERE